MKEELIRKTEKEIATQIQIEKLTAEANECKQENELLKAELEKLKEQKPKKKKRKWLFF